MVRTSEYGSPFRNVDSGYISSNDKENRQRLRQAVESFVKSEEQNEERWAQYVEKKGFKENYVRYYAPASALVLSKFYCDAFCSPRAYYFKRLFAGFTSLCALRYAFFVESRQEARFYTANFPLFPVEIQRALEHQDARYARSYLQ